VPFPFSLYLRVIWPLQVVLTCPHARPKTRSFGHPCPAYCCSSQRLTAPWVCFPVVFSSCGLPEDCPSILALLCHSEFPETVPVGQTLSPECAYISPWSSPGVRPELLWPTFPCCFVAVALCYRHWMLLTSPFCLVSGSYRCRYAFSKECFLPLIWLFCLLSLFPLWNSCHFRCHLWLCSLKSLITTLPTFPFYLEALLMFHL
jgi:hypothetical protein